MTSALARYQRLVGRVRTRWTPARAREVEEQTLRALERRHTTRRVAVGLVAIAASALLVSQVNGLWPGGSSAKVAVPAPATAPLPARSAMALEDGSLVTLEGDDTVVETLETTASSTDLRVARGAATFRVVHNPGRLFRVHAGGLTAEVIGTVFTVTRLADEARVQVINGRVRVSYNEQESTLSEGDSVVVADRDRVAAPPTSSPEPAGVTAKPSPPWRELAHASDFEQAYRSLERAGRSDVRDQPDDLLLAADVARLSHHPAEALPHLRAVVSRHRHDPRAPLAAFTLGRVLLESLGRPGEAANAFRTSQDLAPSGLLVEDALAREVEALSKAGETTAARGRAELYVRRYPQGRKVSLVRRHGGLD